MWLARARATHRYDMTQATVDGHLAALRSDPRFAALLPQAAEFAAPFVERVHIIREWRGEHPNDQFGWIARNIGDVDGDGINDVVTSAPTHGAQGAGRIYVYSTGRDRLLWSADGAAATSSAPASRPPATPITTVSPTSSPAVLPAAASRASTPAVTDGCCTSSRPARR